MIMIVQMVWSLFDLISNGGTPRTSVALAATLNACSRDNRSDRSLCDLIVLEIGACSDVIVLEVDIVSTDQLSRRRYKSVCKIEGVSHKFL